MSGKHRVAPDLSKHVMAVVQAHADQEAHVREEWEKLQEKRKAEGAKPYGAK